MTNYTTDAINIKSYNLNESDKIVVMYSKDHGLIRCVAKGVKSLKSKIGGRMDLLIANKLLISKRKNLDVIYQADGIDTFKNIRKDISKLTYAMYCSEIVGNFGLENDSNSSNVYNSFYKTLNNIAKSDGLDELLYSVVQFQLNFMELMGYAVELDSCARCNSDINSDIYSFCSESGGIVCCNCDNTSQNNNFNDNVRQVMKEIQKSVPIEDLNLNKFVLNCCFDMLGNYISSRSHKKFKTSGMIECLCC